MKTGTKWLLGILIGLVAIAALCAVTYFAVRWWDGSGWEMGARISRSWEGGQARPWHMVPQRPGRIAPFFPSGGFFALRLLGVGLLCLSLLALIGLAIVALVRSLARPSTSTVGPFPPAAPAPPPAFACPNCGRTVQQDWSHCPYCGTALPQELGETPPA